MRKLVVISSTGRAVMKSMGSLVLLYALLGIIAIGQQIENGDAKRIVIIMTGGRIESTKTETPKTPSFTQRHHHKKEKWIRLWVKRMMLSKK